MGAPWPGRWRRLRLTAPGRADDTTTLVLWLQSAHWFVDLRMPAGRPSFAGCRALTDCTQAQRDWLATQEAFAGRLEDYDGLLHWQRHIDLHARTALADMGRMTRTGTDTWLEVGAVADYEEDWQHLPHAGGACDGIKFVFEDAGGVPRWRQGIAVRVDDACMYALQGSLAEGGLDAEFAFGRMAAGALHIEHSTLPFREGLALPAGVADAPFAWLAAHPALAGRALRILGAGADATA